MQGEPADPSSPQDDPDEVVSRLRQQMTRLKRWLQWELWLLEPRSFAPPKDPLEDDAPESQDPTAH